MNYPSIIQWILNNGVPLETIRLILMLPIIATLIAFLRQFVGIKAFGIYTPLIITFAFWATGVKYGIAIFLAVLLVGMMMRFILKPFRLLYLPRVTLMLFVVALVILALLAWGGSLKKTGLASVSIFPILIIITLVEKFVAVQIEKGNMTASILALETLLISLLGFYLIRWETFWQLLLHYPYLVLLVIPANILLGKWTGLRLNEYWRFRQVIKKM